VSKSDFQPNLDFLEHRVAIPPGFSLHKSATREEDVALLVPTAVEDQIEREAKERHQREVEERKRASARGSQESHRGGKLGGCDRSERFAGQAYPFFAHHPGRTAFAAPSRRITPTADWKTSLPKLALERPNFEPVVTFIARRLALAALRGSDR
jgi:hypothetical protein